MKTPLKICIYIDNFLWWLQTQIMIRAQHDMKRWGWRMRMGRG